MLNCYPINATAENWLHDTLVSMIESLHQNIALGNVPKKSQVSWKSLLPTNLPANLKKDISASHGLRDKFFAYMDAIQPLSAPQRSQILKILQDQNKIHDLVTGKGGLPLIPISLINVRDAAYDLFVFAFGKLTDFEVRKRQYQIIFDSLGNKICPFCGIERVMDPEETAQDQDHYLAKSLYPFSAANMRNLVPMCICCNRVYKKAQDVISDENGKQRIAFDPYDCIPPKVSLMNSVIDDKALLPIPEWNINFLPASQEAETWDAVFKIRTRYKRDILNHHYGTWLQGFRSKCALDRANGKLAEKLTQKQIRDALEEYRDYKAVSPSIGMAGFLEPLVFDFLLQKFDQGEVRIVDLVHDAVLGI